MKRATIIDDEPLEIGFAVTSIKKKCKDDVQVVATSNSLQKSNRRKFLRNISLGAGALSVSIPSLAKVKIDEEDKIELPDHGKQNFQPFFTTNPTGQGTGLGLSLAYDIITKGHGGELKVKTKKGEGSAFTIQLPIS